MIGREAYHRPEVLAELDSALYPRATPVSFRPAEIVAAMGEYALRETRLGTPLNAITRHMLGLISGRPGARALRQLLSADVRQGIDAAEVFGRAEALVRQAA
jgi:tRNA-dihydrouridine synthase A